MAAMVGHADECRAPPRSARKEEARAKPAQRVSFASSKRVAAAPLPVAEPYAEAAPAKLAAHPKPAEPVAEVAAPAEAAAPAADQDPNPAHAEGAGVEAAGEPVDAEIVVVPCEEDAAGEGHMQAEAAPYAGGHLVGDPAAHADAPAVTHTPAPVEEGPAADVAAEVEAALAPAPAADPDPNPAHKHEGRGAPAAPPAVILLPAPPTAEPAADLPIADKPAAEAVMGSAALGDALPVVPEAGEAEMQARASPVQSLSSLHMCHSSRGSLRTASCLYCCLTDLTCWRATCWRA